MFSVDWFSLIVFALTSCDVIFLVSIGLVTGLGASVTVLGGGVGLSFVGGVADVTAVSVVFCVSSGVIVSLLFSLSLFACTSSNHFSKIGIASSKFGVPEEEIFCLPSI